MFIVFHRTSTQMIKSFASVSSAKRSMTCMNRNAGSYQYEYTTDEDYHTRVVTKKTVKNLMTGQEVQIDSNTPRCCDPSSEAYWSM
jgi:hypothetical protein